MPRTCRALWLAVTLLPAVPAGGQSAAIAWEKDFKTASRRAKSEGRPMMVDFWAEWCTWCHELDTKTYRDPKVIDLVGEGFVPVKVNTEGNLTGVELAAQFGVETLPTIEFFSPAGRPFLRRTEFEAPDVFPATLEEAQRLSKDVAAWERSLARDDKDPAALAALGGLLCEQKLTKDGRDLLRRARKVDQNRPVAERKRTRRLLADAERATGGKDEARRLLQEGLALAPADPGEDAAIEAALSR